MKAEWSTADTVKAAWVRWWLWQYHRWMETRYEIMKSKYFMAILGEGKARVSHSPPPSPKSLIMPSL